MIASGRNDDQLDALAVATGCRTLPFDLDLGGKRPRARSKGSIVWGVVNCGGFGGEIATPMDTDIAVFDKVISINARGALLVTKYASQSMIRLGKGGAIVNVSSQARSWHSRATSPTARRRPRSTTSPASPRSSSADTASASTA